MTAPNRPHAPLYAVRLKGGSHERGLQHGRALRSPIGQAIAFYREFHARHLGLDAAEVRRRAARFLEPTAAVSPLLLRELEGITGGSGQTLEDVIALSARYELIYETVKLGECSNVFVGPGRSADGRTLLGQSWEWRPEVLDFRAVLTAWCEDMPSHVVVTECGQPGKYGLNEHGLGVTATGLCCTRQTSVGRDLIVVLARQALAQRDLAAAADVLRGHPPRATCSVFLADDHGRGLNFEAAPGGLMERDLRRDEVAWHTNHCLLTAEPCTFDDSLVRGARWAELTARPGRVGRDTLQAWLADSRNGYGAICKPANPALAGSVTWLQTLCSAVFDLDRREAWVADGLASANPFRRFGLEAASVEDD